jgi:ketosteroid isomerase-like protein
MRSDQAMLKRTIVIFSLALTLALMLASLGMAQNANTSTPPTRQRTVVAKPATPRPAAKATPATEPQTAPTSSGVQRTQTSTATRSPVGTPSGVLAAFNALLEGIRHADVDAVANAYLKSPRLILFNYNGSVTRGWEQMRQNRASSYPDLKDVKLDVRDLRVLMLGRDGALVSCLWTQSQTFRGVPETATGRMTIVFRRVGKEWKAVHLHTSPDVPAPGRVMPSEQTPTPVPKTNP